MLFKLSITKKLMTLFLMSFGMATLSAAELDKRDFYHLGFELQKGLPVVQATVNGTALKLEIDLGGSGQLSLKPDVIRGLGLQADSQSIRTSDAFGKVKETGRYPIESFAVEGLPSSALNANTDKNNPLIATEWTSNNTLDGYIGFDILKQFQLVFDYASKSLRLYPRHTPIQALPSECGTQSLALKRLGNLLYHEFNTEFGLRAFGFDTGANMNVLMQSQMPEADHQNPAPFFKYREFTSAEYSFNPGQFAMVNIKIPKISGILGAQFFQSHLVCLDTVIEKFSATKYETRKPVEK